ncbi:MAG TPA: hypothetical protein O0X39_05375 [Methanocorpusculum sp.]|nr:hypothetical protein [Methanocorpusculum sp.]
MTSTTTTEDKRMYIIWLSVVGMLAVAILLGLLLPNVFTSFWMCAGVFLAGVGLIAGILLLFMGKRYVSFFSLFLVVAGIVLILSGVFANLGIVLNPFIMPAIAVLVIVIGLILWIVLGKKERETKW